MDGIDFESVGSLPGPADPAGPREDDEDLRSVVRRPHVRLVRAGRTALVGGLVALLLAGCWEDGGTVCPAIAYGRTLLVELAPDWPAGDGRTLLVACDGPCSEVFVEDGAPGPGPDRLTVPLDDGRAAVSWTAPQDSVELTVLAPDGTPLAAVDTDLDWVRVGGSEECGGPMEATVVVPAP